MSTFHPPHRRTVCRRCLPHSGSARTAGGLLLPTALAAIVLVAAVSTAFAQDASPDQVTLQLPEGSSRITIRCEVVDYTGTSITLKMPNDAPRRTYPASQVVEVRTPQTQEHIRGQALFAAGRIEEAEQALNDGLLDETRSWVRRDILALLCRCALWRGDLSDAGTRFILLCQSDPQTRHFGLAPLVWTPASLTQELRSQARVWLTHSVPVARLMACSILLDDPDLARTAEAELRQLAVSTNPYLQELARAQSWRIQLGPRPPGPEELEGWQATIEAMPESVRGGAWFVLGQARLARNEPDRAAEALLWLPLVYPHDRHLAARAGLQAAECLALGGRRIPAQTVYRELTERFADTPFAQDARAALQEFSTGEDDTDRPADRNSQQPAARSD